jgi:hypothetical protein
VPEPSDNPAEAAAMAHRYLGDQKVGDDFALRRQQRAETSESGPDQIYIGGDEAVEKVAGILAADFDHAPIDEKCRFHGILEWRILEALTGRSFAKNRATPISL